MLHMICFSFNIPSCDVKFLFHSLIYFNNCIMDIWLWQYQWHVQNVFLSGHCSDMFFLLGLVGSENSLVCSTVFLWDCLQLLGHLHLMCWPKKDNYTLWFCIGLTIWRVICQKGTRRGSTHVGGVDRLTQKHRSCINHWKVSQRTSAQGSLTWLKFNWSEPRNHADNKLHLVHKEED